MASVQTPNETQHNENAGGSRKRKLWLGALALLVVLGIVGVWAWHELYGRWSESTDDAYVNGNVVEITPLVTGTVVSIGADDGDQVQGQILGADAGAELAFDADGPVAHLARAQRLRRHRAQLARRNAGQPGAEALQADQAALRGLLAQATLGIQAGAEPHRLLEIVEAAVAAAGGLADLEAEAVRADVDRGENAAPGRHGGRGGLGWHA